ncbi:MAG: GNAT family N-acetyltransferase [Gemmatimonadaceae bacterium]|nr:GNAT family N-acetyltransferase [Gemmatimonadaceae bacterium]NUS96538.1 GNAT family N-acetyltransferase [Gemmatimonadaceae bacterium]
MSAAGVAAWPLADLALARRLERTEALANAAFVEARAALQPEAGAAWIDVAGTYAMFDGPGAPTTQTFGLGLFEPVRAAEMETIESFFRDRGAEVMHEVSPVAPPEVLALLLERGYRPFELSSVLFRPLGSADARASGDAAIRARRVEPGEESVYVDTTAEGWSETRELADFIRGYAAITARARGTHCFIAELDGRPVGAGAMAIHGGVALLAGASTIPAWRGRGGQRALLEARLRFAVEQGADLAVMAAAPGGGSQRNAERRGFRIAYTRIKWRG